MPFIVEFQELRPDHCQLRNSNLERAAEFSLPPRVVARRLAGLLKAAATSSSRLIFPVSPFGLSGSEMEE